MELDAWMSARRAANACEAIVEGYCKNVSCRWCKGTGLIDAYDEDASMSYQATCPECAGEPKRVVAVPTRFEETDEWARDMNLLSETAFREKYAHLYERE